MANENLTVQEQTEVWNRGEKVLEKLLTIYPIEKLEAIGIYLSNKENRQGIGYNKLMGSLNKIIEKENLKPIK